MEEFITRNLKNKRPLSCLPVLQSHPCYQSDLYSDQRAINIYKLWKEKNIFDLPHSKISENNLNFEDTDYNKINQIKIETVIY